MQTYSLLKNWMLYFNDIRLVGASMLAFYVLGHFRRPEEWHHEELVRARDICDLHTPDNSKWWHDYLSVLGSGSFRDCLVTESAKLDRCLTCPGLGKFLLGSWLLADKLTPQELVDRCQASVAEFIGRSKITLAHFFRVHQGECILNRDLAQRVALPAKHFTLRQILSALRVAVDADIKAANEALRSSTRITFNVDRLEAFEQYHMSVEQIQCFYSRLIKADWEGLSEVELLRALLTGLSSNNSYQRSRCADFRDASMEELLSQVTAKLSGKGVGAEREEVLSKAKGTVLAQLYAKHTGIPRIVPAELVARYKEETGRDIAATWKLDKSGLSPVACCFPGCNLYLSIPDGDEKAQRAATKAHLHTCCQFNIPGLHHCVETFKHLPADKISMLARAGVELNTPFLPRDVTRRLAKGVGGYGGVPCFFATAEEYRIHAIDEAERAVSKKIKAAIDKFTGGDDAKFLELIEDIKASLTAKWDYADFKATFDAKYGL
jgi:hypothetical protein